MKYACTCESADSCVLHPPGTSGGPCLPLPEGRVARLTTEWSKLAQEAFEVEIVGGMVYAFGSELAVLRLHYRLGVGRVSYSTNRKRWFFTLEGNPQ